MGKSDDRISELPDSILHHILSLMPLQSSARTSALSRRWREHWKIFSPYIETLDFGEEFARSQTPEDFVNTVSQYIKLHKGHKIRTLQLFFDSAHLYSSDTEKWIEFAVTRGATELNLDFCRELEYNFMGDFIGEFRTFKLPRCLFSCDSVIHLNLGHCDFNCPSDFNGFRALKTLSLRQVHITDDMLESITSNCPLLEELNLSGCFSITSINVSGVNLHLKILTVVVCGASWIEISAPNLQSFHYCGDLFFGYSFKNVSSLVDVLLNSTYWEDTEPEHDYIKILKDLAHVKILTIGSGPLLYITLRGEEEYDKEDMPITFYNLQELQLVYLPLSDEYLSYFYGFFRNCNFPCLEKLFIDVPPEFFGGEYQNYSLEEPTACIFYCLKAIQISGFRGCKNEMRLVKFLLQKAIVLETLILILPQNAYSEKDMDSTNVDSTSRLQRDQIPPLMFLREQLASLPKASSDGRIVLCESSEEDNRLWPTHTDVYCGLHP